NIGRATAGIESGALSASGHFKTDGTFDISVRADAVPLEALSSLTAGYADLRGVADGDAAIVGLRAEQDDVHTTGRISVQTTGLRVNGQDVGDLRAALAMNGRTLSGVATDGPPLALGQEPGRAVVSDITYDLDSRRFAVVGSLSGMDLDAIRRIVERSPTVMAGEAAEPLSRAMAALAPITGRFGGSASVSGTPDDWRVLATFDGAGLSLGDLRPDAFAAEVEATNRDLVMRSAELRSGDAIVSAEGELVFGERIAGLVSAQGIDFGVVSQWFPADSRARGLSGVLDTATAEITGKPSVPEVSLVASARGVSYRSPEASGGARDVTAPAIRLSGAVIREGWAGFEDLAVTLAQADGTGGRSQAPPVEVHAAGRVPFTWQSPFVAQDAVAELTVRLPETDLRSFQNLTTGGQVDMVGTVGAEVTVRGTREQAENLTEGFKAGDDRLAITGTAWLKAEQIRAFQMRTVLGDLDLRLALDGDRVSVVERPDGKPTGMFFALGSGTDPRTEAGSLILAGSLALTDPAGRPNELTIRAPRLRFDEAPFPGFGTGRVSGEVAAGAGAREEGGRRPDGVRLVVSGSVMEPSIAGSVTLKSVAMRLPVTEAAVRTKRPVPLINPKFDIGIYVPDGASVRSTLVQASLATNPSAPIRITGSLADPRVAGSLAIQSGFLNFPTARFAIRRGGLVALRYPGASSVGAEDAGLDVTVDLSAQARISAESVTGQRKRYLVTVEAKGPLLERPSDPIGGSDSRMRLTYRADPPDLALSRDGLARRVQALLGGQDALQAVFSRQGDAGGLLVGKVVDYLGGALMPDLVDQTGVGRALGLQELTVDYSRGGAFVLRLSRDLFGPFEVAYWRNLSGVRDHPSDSGDWEFRLGIRLRRGFRLTWVIDDQRTNAYRLEGVYSF
ncbi:MAG: hypothetical protein FJX72_09290, partial [Armatimonadetes bacterium]|nr:hypothetical protein [Armatimonadota bacterium]